MKEHDVRAQILRSKMFADWIEVAQDRVQWRDFVEH
jgi:hypothetical protein